MVWVPGILAIIHRGLKGLASNATYRYVVRLAMIDPVHKDPEWRRDQWDRHKDHD